MVCARFGGEEFTLAVKDAGDLAAARLARNIIHAVESLAIVHPGRSDGIGVVTVMLAWHLPRGKTAMQDAIFQAADRALYEAKRRGRNCFVLDRNGNSSVPVNGAG